MATMVQAVGMGLHGGAAAVSGTTAARESVAKNVLLFFAAPFIGLAYIVVFPFVGTVALVKTALR